MQIICDIIHVADRTFENIQNFNISSLNSYNCFDVIGKFFSHDSDWYISKCNHDILVIEKSSKLICKINDIIMSNIEPLSFYSIVLFANYRLLSLFKYSWKMLKIIIYQIEDKKILQRRTTY